MKPFIALLFFFITAYSAWGQKGEKHIPEDYLKDREKPVLVMFTAAWCGPCQLLKADVLTHSDVKLLLTQMNFLIMDIDTEEGKNTRAMLGCDKKGIPHLILMDKDQKVIDEYNGYSKDIAKFTDFLNKALKPKTSEP